MTLDAIRQREREGRLSFRIVGIPKSKGSLTPIPYTDRQGVARARNIEKKSTAARAALTDWRDACQRVFKMGAGHGSRFGTIRGKYLQPVAVGIQFSLPRPKSAPSYVLACTTYPDIDKLTRVVLDELRLWILTDDRQIVELHVTKIYGDPPGAIVRLWPCEAPKAEIWT